MRSALGLLGSLLLILCAAAAAAAATAAGGGAGPATGLSTEDPVVFRAMSGQNLFPAGVRFQAEAQAEAQIIAAEIWYGVQGEAATYREPVTAAPGGPARLEYYWDTRGQGVPPGATLTYQWHVTTADGARAVSPVQTVSYTDGRFAWQVLAGDRAEVWWHDGAQETAARVLSIAGQAVEHQDRVFETKQSERARVILYNTHDEFAAWQPGVPAFVDGKAFPALNLTVQVIEPVKAGGDWPLAVIPHELSRLHFAQAAGGPNSPAPAWLDEGLALYNEFVEHPAEEQALKAAILRQDLTPLADLPGALASTGEQRVRVAQAEALSAVRYLMYQYGPERVAGLLRAFRDGRPADAAFRAAFGLSPDRIEENWQVWLGVPEAWRAAAQARATTAAGTAAMTAPAPVATAPVATVEAKLVKDDSKPRSPGDRLLAAGGVTVLAVLGPLAMILMVGSWRARKERGRS